MVQASLSLFPPGWFHDYYLRGGRTDMPPGMKHAVCTPSNIPDSVFLNGGASHIAYKQGADIAKIVAAGTPREKISVFVENPWIWHDANPSQPTSEWNRDQCRKAVDDYVLFRSGGLLPGMLVLATEAYDYLFDWRLGGDNAPQQLKWICERFGELAAQTPGGCIFNPNYYGNLDLQWTFYDKKSDDLIAPLLDNDKALDFVKGHEHPETQYFKLELWRYKTAMLVSGYRLNQWTDYEFIIKIAAQLALTKRALHSNQIGYKPEVIDYHMPAGSQFENYSDFAPRIKVKGGSIKGGGHNRRSYGVGVGHAAIAYNEGATIRSEWEDCFRYGLSRDVIKKNRWDQDFIPDGNPLGQEIDPAYEYQPNGSGINAVPVGGWNAHEDGARWKGLIYRLIGHNNAQYCQHRFEKTLYSDTATDGATIIRNYQKRKALVYKYENKAGDWAIEGFTPEDAGWRTYQFNVAGGVEAYLPPNQPFLLLSRRPDKVINY